MAEKNTFEKIFCAVFVLCILATLVYTGVFFFLSHEAGIDTGIRESNERVLDSERRVLESQQRVSGASQDFRYEDKSNEDSHNNGFRDRVILCMRIVSICVMSAQFLLTLLIIFVLTVIVVWVFKRESTPRVNFQNNNADTDGSAV